MFLKDLHEEAQKHLFLELATLILMAAGSSITSYEYINSLNLDNLSIIFWNNIEEKEATILFQYDNELNGNRGSFLKGSDSSPKRIITRLSEETSVYFLQSSLLEQTNGTLSEYSQLEEFKKEVMQKILESGEDILNINPEMIQKFMLNTDVVKSDILKRTARQIVSIRKDSLGQFGSKEKKIVLFELIGAGFSSGNFEDAEKELLESICDALEIEKEYIREFMEVSTELFAVNKELIELINE